MKLDQIDYKILDEIQANARITNADLAARVGLSPTPCLRRLRRLEKEGVIKGYRTELNREALGVNVTAIFMIKLKREDESTLKGFEKMMLGREEVVECLFVTGKFDYIVRVLIPTLNDYEEFLGETILRMSHVEAVETSFVLREVKQQDYIPIPGAPE